MRRLFSITLLLFLPVLVSTAQDNFPKNYFRMPMNIPPRIAGNFGELRPNHFHAGLDFSTSNKEGIPVMASAEGFVTRIKVGPYGYGRVLYVMHPNGYVTVYAHLSKFNTEIGKYVENEQYSRESFEVELFPRPGELPVKQGQVMGYSGNTGSSGGPHLHFEIRDANTEEALNPQLFGLPIGDSIPPTPQTLVVYELDGAAEVKGAKSGRKKIPLKKSGQKYVFANPSDSIVASGKIGFAMEGFDQEDTRHGKNGVYGMQVWKNDKLIYSHGFRKMGFDESRYINCYIDYPELQTGKKYYQKSFLAPNNKLPIYDSVVSQGQILVTGDSVHRMKYVLIDVNGNTATAEFKIKGSGKHIGHGTTGPKKWDQENVLQSEHFRLVIPAGALYEDVYLKSSSSRAAGATWPTVSLHNDQTPLQVPCSLTIKPAVKIPDSLFSKLLVVEISRKGGRSSVGGVYENGQITTTVKAFGNYSVALDTTAPSVKPANFDQKGIQSSFAALKSIGFTVGDNLAGIGSYKLYIDGKWVLLEYEPKKKLLYYTFDSRVGKGDHELRLLVADKKGNTTEYKKKFTR